MDRRLVVGLQGKRFVSNGNSPAKPGHLESIFRIKISGFCGCDPLCCRLWDDNLVTRNMDHRQIRHPHLSFTRSTLVRARREMKNEFGEIKSISIFLH
jgi:hypothetical protein